MDEMNKLTLLRTLKRHIPTEELITREESSQIRQSLYDFMQPFEYQETDLIRESISDLTIECVELMCIFVIEVINSIRTVFHRLCVQNASPLFTQPLTTHSIFTTISVRYLI